MNQCRGTSFEMVVGRMFGNRLSTGISGICVGSTAVARSLVMERRS